MDLAVFKKIYKKIKSYDKIVLARHVGPDPDAIASQLALRDSIKLTFPKKTVLAIGNGVSKFKTYGSLDKLNEEDLNNSLLIALDVPGILRIDGAKVADFKEVIKIDHHPYEDKMGEVEYVNELSSSTCELVLELIFNTGLEINQKIAENLYLGIVSDSNRFQTVYTSPNTFEIVAKLLRETNIDFVSLYDRLYERPLSEVRFHGYLSQNIKVTKNGLGYIYISNDIIKQFGVDTATASNMVNDFNFIKEIKVWMFITHDERNDLYKINIRSRGPIINEVAALFNGGGHKFASGIRTTDKRELDNILKAFDEVCKNFDEKEV